ncbi:MAG TPA: NlpC/P60 family protein [Bryobacteraceae bacterium]|nr:NlpC/P60 family protein [Bryobacteraceae bacterium]
MAVALFASAHAGAVVVRPVANMYSRPTRDADVVSQAIYGAGVDRLEEESGWTKIRTADQYTGWMPVEDLRPLRSGERPYAASGKVAQVDSLFAHLYREPDVTRHEPLLTVPFETRLEVVAEPSDQPRWLQVRLPDDRPAWVQRGDVLTDPRPLSLEEMLALSKRFLGLPYTWGGASSFGFDCSGFTQMLYRRHGVLLPRDAGPQAAWEGVQPVDRGHLRPGDLLFFGSSAAHITHTGLYLGGGQFINATTHIRPIVQICDLQDPHWTRLLVACRRVK